MIRSIPYGRQSISEDDIKAVVNVLRSDWLTQGPTIDRFEKAVAQYCGAKYAVAVNSATSALHIACLAASLGEGDLFWTSPNSFVASANCGLYCGAKVDFIDIAADTYNLSVAELEKKLSLSKENGSLPKVLIPVHFAGQSCEMERIAELSKEYGFTVIEDASHAIGGKYHGAPVGDCRFADMAIFSFHPVKIITTGEGGIVLTNSCEQYDKLVRLRSHGITRDSTLMVGESHGPWYYQQVDLGFNYRMTDIQAALGLSQLKRLDEFVNKRYQLAAKYNKALSGLPLTLPYQIPDAHSAFHLYVIRLQLDRINKTHRQVFEELRAAGILVNLHYIPIHTQPYYQNMGFKSGDYPEAEQFYREAISLPMYPTLQDAEFTHIVTSLHRIIGKINC